MRGEGAPFPSADSIFSSLCGTISIRHVPPTNNESERSLRPCATYRKITNGFRSQWGAIQYADIRSAIETGRRQSIGALQAIRDVLAAPVDVPLFDTG